MHIYVMGYDGSIVCPDEWQSFCHEPSILNYGSPLPSPSPPDGGGGSDDGGGASLLDTISHAQQKYPGCTETRSWDQILTPSTPTGGMGKWMVMGTFEVWREREKGMDGWREGERQCSGGIHIHDFHFSFDSLSSSFSLCSRARARALSLSVSLSLSLFLSLHLMLWQVWLCLHDNICSNGEDPFCYTFNEATEAFVPLGFNSELSLMKPPTAGTTPPPSSPGPLSSR